MVRIISQNFSPQRSRHSSGETDRYLAERASSALGLSLLAKKRFDLPECESSSDSFWDSELDGEHHDAAFSEHGEDQNDINGNETLKKSNAQSKRKERRRERNKLSAQAYRQRRRSQNMKEQQQLQELEAENRRLHQLVETLERKTEQTKQFLRGSSVQMPDILLPPSSSDTAASAGAASTDSADVPHTSTHGAARCSKGDPSNPVSPCAQATTSTLPVAYNVNHGVKKTSLSHVLNENCSSGASPSNQHQDAATVSPVPASPILMNANALVKSQLQVPGMATGPTFSLMTIPVDCNTTANFNLNSHPRSQKAPPSHSARRTLAMAESKSCPPAATGCPVVGAFMWSLDGSPPPGAVYSLMNIEVCDNKNIDNNMISNVFTQNSNGGGKTISGAAPDAPVTVNLNEVKITGEPLQFWHAHHN
ncbi:hypothetical protein EGW08_012363 [Elysia chlorotica]|uniref:BZIP domain-containing protein n=1 Tax=Elysia chlorotica TaxID=188477 RepID=A0A433TE95_ELYCH|nr:hypothetical protein EGW08_012363 [Elysia chlorotica]